MDVTAAVTAINDGGTAAATIGVAALILTIGIAVWKKLQRVN